MEWMLTHVVAPVVSTVLGVVATVVLPVLTARGVAYLSRRWRLDIDARESARLEALAVDIVHKVEAQLGAGRGADKLGEAMRELVAQAAVIGLDVAEGVARAKIEKALHDEQI